MQKPYQSMDQKLWIFDRSFILLLWERSVTCYHRVCWMNDFSTEWFLHHMGTNWNKFLWVQNWNNLFKSRAFLDHIFHSTIRSLLPNPKSLKSYFLLRFPRRLQRCKSKWILASRPSSRMVWRCGTGLCSLSSAISSVIWYITSYFLSIYSTSSIIAIERITFGFLLADY